MMEPDEQGFEFDIETMEKDAANFAKRGPSEMRLMMVVLMEEVGEIARASLENEGPERLRAEITDASSVLRRMYIQAEEL